MKAFRKLHEISTCANDSRGEEKRGGSEKYSLRHAGVYAPPLGFPEISTDSDAVTLAESGVRSIPEEPPSVNCAAGDIARVGIMAAQESRCRVSDAPDGRK